MDDQNKEVILLDADVIIHFLKGNILYLPKIYPDQLSILDVVKKELCSNQRLRTPVDNFISFFKINIIPFPTEVDIIKEYASLKKMFGEGESACMALARFKKFCIASSNLRDIENYCLTNGVKYLTTMDILVEGLNKNVLTETECDTFISEVLKKGSKLPDRTIKEYIKNIKTKINMTSSDISEKDTDTLS